MEEVARLACSCEPPTLDTADLESCVKRAARLDATAAYQFYDLTRAVFNAWELKKARAVTLVAQSSAGQSYQNAARLRALRREGARLATVSCSLSRHRRGRLAGLHGARFVF